MALDAFINHFHDIRRTPSVKFVYNAAQGLNACALSFVVRTRNKQGMGATELVSNYGLDFDRAKNVSKSDRYLDRFKGPMLKFVRQSAVVAMEVDAPSSQEVACCSSAGRPAATSEGAACAVEAQTPECAVDAQTPASVSSRTPEGGSSGDTDPNRRQRTGGVIEVTAPSKFNLLHLGTPWAT